jgi:hypothetical protein
MLDETFAACPACSLNARGAKLTDVFAVWNVVTHGYNSEFVPVLFLARVRYEVKATG